MDVLNENTMAFLREISANISVDNLQEYYGLDSDCANSCSNCNNNCAGDCYTTCDDSCHSSCDLTE